MIAKVVECSVRWSSQSISFQAKFIRHAYGITQVVERSAEWNFHILSALKVDLSPFTYRTVSKGFLHPPHNQMQL